MNEDNKERPFSKLVLEIGPLIIFFLCYYKAPIPENIVNDIKSRLILNQDKKAKLEDSINRLNY